ncbi:hypothetical protein JCM8097_003400 [Rhodosporidiobolus ruineniae]
MSAGSFTAEDLSLPSRNIAFVLHGADHVEYEERPMPGEPGPNEYVACTALSTTEQPPLTYSSSSRRVIIAPKAIGVCGSDIHVFSAGRIGSHIIKEPFVLGHETAGVVVKVGRAVQNLKPGDRVAVEPGEPCRECPECKGGQYQLCEKMLFAGVPTPRHDGTLCGFYRLAADLCFKLPDHMSLEEGALIEPLSVGVHALTHVGHMKPASNVVVFGAGPVGLLTAAAAKGLGAARVIAIDIQEQRLQFAKDAGLVHDYYLPPKPQDGESREDYPIRSAVEIRKRFGFAEHGPKGVDLVLDCSGAEVCVQTACHLLKHGGTLVQVGIGKADVSVPLHTVLTHELSLKGSWRYGPGVYDLALDLVARGAVNLKPLVTHRYPFTEALRGMTDCRRGYSDDGKNTIKVVIGGSDERANNLKLGEKVVLS